MKRFTEQKATSNPTVWNRLNRYKLGCPMCPPHRAENKKSHKKYGVKRPKEKQRKRS